MATVASLFGTQLEATRAMDALAKSPFADVETHVYEPENDNTDIAVPGAGTVLGDLVVPFADSEIGDLGEEERAWFAEGLRGGGTVVVATVDDEQAAELEQFFASHGGRTSREN
jgi:hypothetical protein